MHWPTMWANRNEEDLLIKRASAGLPFVNRDNVTYCRRCQMSQSATTDTYDVPVCTYIIYKEYRSEVRKTVANFCTLFTLIDVSCLRYCKELNAFSPLPPLCLSSFVILFLSSHRLPPRRPFLQRTIALELCTPSVIQVHLLRAYAFPPAQP